MSSTNQVCLRAVVSEANPNTTEFLLALKISGTKVTGTCEQKTAATQGDSVVFEVVGENTTSSNGNQLLLLEGSIGGILLGPGIAIKGEYSADFKTGTTSIEISNPDTKQDEKYDNLPTTSFQCP